MIIDLRSDTVTKPTPGMLDAMQSAKVGDDVFDEDPTVHDLEEYAADLFGMEKALFCPSGTMTNQIAIKLHTQPLEEVICDRLAHIYNYEGGGIAFNSAASVRTIGGDRGRLNIHDVQSNINPDDIHCPKTSLVALENTCNKGGGSIYDFKTIKEISLFCRTQAINIHLDGARLFNALAETAQRPIDYGAPFDTISICLSKGLGAPVGSLLIGSSKNIKTARRIRKVFGGGMRQAGYLAAAGLYALKHHTERLTEDHQRAKILKKALQEASSVSEVYPVETNIVIFRVEDDIDISEVINKLRDQNILAVAMGPKLIRFVTHLDFTDDMLDQTTRTLKSIFK